MRPSRSSVPLRNRHDFSEVPLDDRPDILELADDARIPVALVDPHPDNPRALLPDIEAFADNIAAFGLLQPIVVRRIGPRYQLIGGHRRLAAFQLLHARDPQDQRWCFISAVVRRTDDDTSYLAAISMHAHSRRWTPQEEARVLERLSETRTLREVAEIVHRSGPWVSHRLKVYSDPVLSGFVQAGRLKADVAAELRYVADLEQRREYAELASQEQWSGAHAREKARRLKRADHFAEVETLARKLEEALVWVEAAEMSADTQRRLAALRGRIDNLLNPVQARRAGGSSRSARSAVAVFLEHVGEPMAN